MTTTSLFVAAGAVVAMSTSISGQTLRFPPPSATPFLETIHEASSRLKLLDLAAAPHAGREIRLWDGFGLGGVRLLILRETGSSWRALSAYPVDRASSVPVAQLPDTSDWACRWRAAVDEGLLQLPPYPRRDSTTILVNDGYGAVIEWFDGTRYGISGAGNPGTYGSPDDRQFLRVVDAVLDQVRTPRCSKRK